jgi:hydroxymethylpyrimidine pyrophosphatase-like HAD family hydrolase
MSKTIRKIKRYKDARKRIEELVDNPEWKLLIHYSCESFYDIKEGRTPRITSIAVRFLQNAQTKSFSIHKIAEIKKIDFNKIEDHYDELEKQMLKDFFDFVKDHKDYIWIHWNMRDINYGFEAIENRFLVLGGVPIHIEDNRKIDLARLLIDKYGVGYIGHPRLQKLLEKNNIKALNLLSGKEEAEAFENKQYVKLHQSTLRKVDVMENILKRAADEDLKTNSSWRDIYGITPQGIFELIKDNWLLSLIVSILSILIGFGLSKI